MKKGISVFFTIMIFILLYFVLRNIDFVEVWKLLKNINFIYFGIAVVFSLFSFVVWNFRSQYSLGKLVKGEYWFMLHTLFAGLFFNTITPGTNFGGEPVKMYFLSRRYKKRQSYILGGLLADKIFHVMIYGAFLLFSVAFVLLYIKIPYQAKIFFEIALVLVLILTGIISFLVFSDNEENVVWILRKFYMLGFVRRKFASFKEFEDIIKEAVNNLMKVFRKVFYCKDCFSVGIFLSTMFWIFTFLTSYFVFLALGASISFLNVVIVVTLGMGLGDLSPIPGGVGFVEGTMFLLYAAMGIFAPLAVSAVLLSRVIYYFFSLFVGGISLLYLRWVIKKKRKKRN